MNVSRAAIEMIQHHEGVRYKPYRCPAALWTVGVGHVLYPEQAKLPDRMAMGLKLSDDRIWATNEIEDLLAFDLQRFERGVVQLCPALTQGMFDGLVSFSFNVGLGTLQRSTLRQKLLRGEKNNAANEFLKYVYANGKILQGLVNRRKDERAVFLS